MNFKKVMTILTCSLLITSQTTIPTFASEVNSNITEDNVTSNETTTETLSDNNSNNNNNNNASNDNSNSENGNNNNIIENNNNSNISQNTTSNVNSDQNNVNNNKNNNSNSNNINNNSSNANPTNVNAKEVIQKQDNTNTNNSNSDAEILTKQFNSTMKSQNSKYHVYHYKNGNINTEKFIFTIAEQARIIAEKNNIYASVIIANAVLESNNGLNVNSLKPCFNLFNIQQDIFGNSSFIINQNNIYKTYNNTFDSIIDYSTIMNDDHLRYFYYGASKSNSNSPQEAAEYIQKRYQKSDNYSEEIMNIINTYDLTRYDNPENIYIDSVYGYRNNQKSGNDLSMNDYAKLEGIITSKLGYNYVWGGESDAEGGYDCSGLIYYAFQETFGITLPRTSGEMQHMGTEVSFDDLRMGDLLFFKNKKGITHHVAMYLGNGYFIESPDFNKTVCITSIDEKRPSFAKRIINFDNKDEYGNVLNNDGSIKMTPDQVFSNENVE